MHFATQFSVPTVFWIIVAIQIAGLCSAALARRSIGRRGQRPCQWLFCSCLTLVALSTMVAMGVSVASWMFCAGTLALMILAAVWDFGGPREVEAV